MVICHHHMWPFKIGKIVWLCQPIHGVKRWLTSKLRWCPQGQHTRFSLCQKTSDLNGFNTWDWLVSSPQKGVNWDLLLGRIPDSLRISIFLVLHIAIAGLCLILFSAERSIGWSTIKRRNMETKPLSEQVAFLQFISWNWERSPPVSDHPKWQLTHLQGLQQKQTQLLEPAGHLLGLGLESCHHQKLERPKSQQIQQDRSKCTGCRLNLLHTFQFILDFRAVSTLNLNIAHDDPWVQSLSCVQSWSPEYCWLHRQWLEGRPLSINQPIKSNQIKSNQNQNQINHSLIIDLCKNYHRRFIDSSNKIFRG